MLQKNQSLPENKNTSGVMKSVFACSLATLLFTTRSHLVLIKKYTTLYTVNHEKRNSSHFGR